MALSSVMFFIRHDRSQQLVYLYDYFLLCHLIQPKQTLKTERQTERK
jgi:hypothetical protein